jgi:hypothetical protein
MVCSDKSTCSGFKAGGKPTEVLTIAFRSGEGSIISASVKRFLNAVS